MGVCNCSMFSCMLLYVHSSFATILMGKRELIALPSLSSWCLVMVVWLFPAVPWVCPQFVIVVFPDHTHYFLPYLFQMGNHNSLKKARGLYWELIQQQAIEEEIEHFKL